MQSLLSNLTSVRQRDREVTTLLPHVQNYNDGPDSGISQSQSSGARSNSGSTEDSGSSDGNSITSSNGITPITSNTSSDSSLSVGTSNLKRDACLSEPSFLELCINQGEDVIALNEIHLRQIQDDGNLFKAIRMAYYQLRGFRRWLFLLKPIDIQYVKVRLVPCSYITLVLITGSSVLKSVTWSASSTCQAILRKRLSKDNCTTIGSHAYRKKSSSTCSTRRNFTESADGWTDCLES